MEQRRASKSQRRLVVPLVLTVSIAGTVAAALSAPGCGTDKPSLDAGNRDGGVDTPIV